MTDKAFKITTPILRSLLRLWSMNELGHQIKSFGMAMNPFVTSCQKRITQLFQICVWWLARRRWWIVTVQAQPPRQATAPTAPWMPSRLYVI